MRRILAFLVALTLSVSAVADEPKLELTLHEMAVVARKAGLKKLVFVARLDASSGQATDGDLDNVEQMALTALKKENAIEGTTNDNAREAARKAKARRALTVDEAKVIKNAAATEGVVALDYREGKERSTVRVLLSDGVKTHFSEVVALTRKVEAVAAGLPIQKAPAGNNGGGLAGKGQGGPIGGNGGQLLQSIPNGASGYAIAMAGGNPNFVRTPNTNVTSGSNGGATSSNSTTAGGKGQASSTGKATAGGTTAGGAVAAGGAGTTAPTQPGAAATEVGQKILQFAISHLGQQVGNGECWTLAAEAMKAAGAQPPDGYTFGDEIPLRSIKPGDVLQFTTARFDEPGFYAIMGAPNHTAIVYSGTGDRVFILQQNFNGNRTVSTFDINLANLTSGRVQAFRPRPR